MEKKYAFYDSRSSGTAKTKRWDKIGVGSIIRIMTEEVVPSEIDSILEWLQGIRNELKLQNISSDKRRLVIRELTEASFRNNRPLTKEETEIVLNKNG